MTSIDHITLDVADTAVAEQFYSAAFGLGSRVRLCAAQPASSGFRGYTLSLIASQPADVSAFTESAIAAGATELKPIAKSLWGYGGVVQAPDGAIWKIATSAKRDAGPARRHVDSIVLLLGVDDVALSKRFYVEHGFTVGKSFGGYVDFAMPGSPITLGLYRRKALAKDAGVAVEGTGSHRIQVTGDAGPFTDPDGFAWATALLPPTSADAVPGPRSASA
ncbi:glyoxalase [Rathayibacter sp. YIM 133350]|uniref:glyoxalase n=1 Tax=Rathayibacter sp. YIM 133350 TaxID=3131992 RepID=UPI00307DF463